MRLEARNRDQQCNPENGLDGAKGSCHDETKWDTEHHLGCSDSHTVAMLSFVAFFVVHLVGQEVYLLPDPR